jgi:hypothetical protein
VATVVAPLVDAGDPALRRGAALVLQDVGAVDALMDGGEAGALERIMDAGGGRLRRAAAERARGRREPDGTRMWLERVS